MDTAKGYYTTFPIFCKYKSAKFFCRMKTFFCGFFCVFLAVLPLSPGIVHRNEIGAVASEDFRGKGNFLKKVSLPPNPYPFKNFEKGQKDSFVLQNICCKSPFKKVFEE